MSFPFSPSLLAALVFAACIVGLLVWIWVALRRSPYTLPQGMLYFANLLFCRILWRVEVQGSIDIPKDQGAVIVCNHRGSHDPVFFQLVADRVVSWFVAREYCELPVVGQLLGLANTIPTNRLGIDTNAVRKAMRITAAGGFVGMIPEGRINSTDAFLLPARPGVAMVALTSRVPVIPCFMSGVPYDGTYWGCILMPARVRINVGEPLDLSEYYGRERDRDVLIEVTKIILRRVAELGGRPDFEPTIAGRRWKTAPGDVDETQAVAAGVSAE